ncbi:MAG TPA: hypothetical protein PKY31_14675 [Spirochaetota bacterium]|nr:hypothetical protein [Spirochaetota bacterium]
MRGLITSIIVLFLALGGAVDLPAADDETRVLVHGEYGWYNKVYKDLQYKDQMATTFAVEMVNAGFEFRRKDAEGNTAGAGMVCTRIAGGSVYNVNRVERQPRTSLLVPYLFTGIDTGMGALELGIGWYITIERAEAVVYYNPDGTEAVDTATGDRVNRTKSHALLNAALRIFPENTLHFKFRYGRERFNGIDSLCNAAAIIPFGRHALEFYAAMPSDWNRRYMPQSNQRYGIAYSVRIGRMRIGINAGYLSFNHRGGGDGNMPIFDRENFSAGSELELSL